MIFSGALMLQSCSDDDSSTSASTTTPAANCPALAAARTLGPNEEAATIPASIAGSYTLTFSESASGSGFGDGDEVTFDVGTDGTISVAGCPVAENPVLYRGNTAEAIWFDDNNGISFQLSNLDTGFNEINIGNDVFYDEAGYMFLGQFTE